MSILPIELINKILYQHKGLQHPIARKCKIHPTAIIMKQLFSLFLTPRAYQEHRYNWYGSRLTTYNEMIEERFEDRQECKDTFYEDIEDRSGAGYAIRTLLWRAKEYEYEDIHEEIQQCKLKTINYNLGHFKTLLEYEYQLEDLDDELVCQWGRAIF